MKYRSGRRRLRSIQVWGFGLFLVLLAGCHSQTAPETELPQKQTAAMTVTAQPVEEISLTEELTLTGTVEPWQKMKVSAELTGSKVVSVTTDVGEEVTFGQPLAYLDARDIRAQLAGAEARYRSALANIDKMRRPNRPQQIAALRAAVEQAKAVVAQEEANLAQVKLNQASAARTADRYSQALAEGYVTANEADVRVTDQNVQLMAIKAAEQRIQAAKYSLAQSEENLRLALAGGRTEDVSIAQAQADDIQATVERLRVDLEKTVVKAPDSGLVLTRSVELGEIASVGKEFFTIARDGRLQLWASVPQHQMPRMKRGQSLTVKSDGKTETGRVEEIDPTVDPSDRQGRVRIELPKDTELRVGAFARATLQGNAAPALAVNAESVQGQTGEEFVFVLEEQTARRVPIKTGRREGDLVEVTDGLEKGQKIIVTGAPFLTDGDRVDVAGS